MKSADLLMFATVFCQFFFFFVVNIEMNCLENSTTTPMSAVWGLHTILPCFLKSYTLVTALWALLCSKSVTESALEESESVIFLNFFLFLRKILVILRFFPLRLQTGLLMGEATGITL